MSVVKAVFRFVLSAIWAVFPFVCIAQVTNAGAVAGVVLAPDGNPVAGVTVALSAPDAPAPIITSADDGTFLLRDLPSGSYTVRTTSASFAPDEESVSVAVGRMTHLSIHLAIASTQQRINVTAAPVTFDTSQTSSVVNIDRDRVEELPIPSRNYLTFVLLAPQVAAANPALQQGLTPSGGSFSFGGLRPGSNAIYLDGVNDNDEYSGSSRTQLSPEAISDFQIVNHGFAAQSGGGAGGSIDVQTRTGVNRIHGDAFTFVQNGALNGTPPLGLKPYKPDESRVRAGVALGGPIQRDKTFYYVAQRSHGHPEPPVSGRPSAHGGIHLFQDNRRCQLRFRTAAEPLRHRQRTLTVSYGPASSLHIKWPVAHRPRPGRPGGRCKERKSRSSDEGAYRPGVCADRQHYEWVPRQPHDWFGQQPGTHLSVRRPSIGR
jgi:hypothetical protein